MRCKTCDYRLWSLTGRQCPECGAAFKPSDFEFTPNSVQFCCPHCDQSYYGTNMQGHLVPSEFDCVCCQRRIHMDDMVLRPTEGVEEHVTAAQSNPWLERQERGFIKSWFAALGRGMTEPTKLMHATPMQSGVGQAWWFALINQIVFYTLSTVLCGGFMAMSMMMGGGTAWRMISAVGGSWLTHIFITMGFIAMWGLLAHWLLRLTGPTAGTLGRTYQAICYCSGANVLMIISSFCSPLIVLGSLIWWAIVGMYSIAEAQRVSIGRAALAATVPPILALIVSMGVLAAWFYMIFSGFGAMSAGSAGPIGQAVLNYAAEHDGAGPDHALRLLMNDSLLAFQLVDDNTMSFESDVSLGDLTLDQFEQFTQQEKQQAVETIVADMPDYVIAHRLGDFVFTYHGMDLNQAGAGLWIVILSPDPDQNDAQDVDVIGPFGQTMPGQMEVTLVDGSTQMLPTSLLGGMLEAQNQLRQAYGLPPLPDPATVTHDHPTVAVDPSADERDPLNGESP